MRDDEEDRRKPPPPRHEVGAPLDTLSVEELSDRVALLREEIARIEAAITSKRASRSAADAFFRS